MKKLLLSMFAVLCALGAQAETKVTFDFDKDATALFGIEGRSSGTGASYVADGEFNEDGVATLDGVTLTVEASPADATNRNRLWKTSPVLRMYNGTLRIAAPGHYITAIVFNTNDKWGITGASIGLLEEKSWYADEAVDDVTFTVEKNTQIKSIVVTLDGEGGEPQPVEIAGTGEGTEASPYDVERALSIIENGKQTTANVYVAGTISSIDEVSTQYGNATYYIAQGDKQIMVYRGKGLGGAAFETGEEIAVGDAVVILGVLKDYNGTPEITGSSIVSINGQGEPEQPEEPEYNVVGNGTKENPYTVADIQHLKIETSDGEKYWVKGVILGSASSATKLNDPEKAVDTNLALGETADATSFIPVAIPAGDLRDVLGVATNPGNVGKTVVVYGTLEKYFSTAGVKNVTDYEMETTGITGIASDCAPVRYYNIQGVEVANPQAGQVYIRVQGTKATKVVK